MSDQTLTEEEIASQIPDGWKYDTETDEIVRSYEFDEYLDGLAFAIEVGELAEAEFHHPTITIEYETVEVRFTDHEAGGVSERDVDMAELTDEHY